MIFQDFIQYMLTVRENIGFGSLKNMSDEQRLKVAAQEAGACRDNFGPSKRLGFDLGRTFDGGSELSLGQWQRVALARALFSSADILILDEPTASFGRKARVRSIPTVRETHQGQDNHSYFTSAFVCQAG